MADQAPTLYGRGMEHHLSDTALVVIDMQMLMQQRIEAGRPHVNPDAPQVIAAVLAAFRAAGRPVFHVRHADADPASPLHPSASGYPAMACAAEIAGEPVLVKTTSSAFASTDLAERLQRAGIVHLHVVGAVAGFCVTSTVRAASDLGFRVSVIRDAVIGFDLPSLSHDAQSIFDVSMALLATNFAEVTDSSAVLGAL